MPLISTRAFRASLLTGTEFGENVRLNCGVGVKISRAAHFVKFNPSIVKALIILAVPISRGIVEVLKALRRLFFDNLG
jgi:hypothetical protein